MEFTLKRNYLTAEEIGFIVGEMVKAENAVTREILRVGLTAQMLIDGLDKYDDNTDIYNVLFENGVNLDNAVFNIDTLTRLTEEEIGVNAVVSQFVSDLNKEMTKAIKKMPKEMKNLDFNGVINKLKEVIDNGSAEKEKLH